MLGVVCARVRNVIEHIIRIHAEAVGNLRESLWTEGTLGVHIHGFTLATASLDRQLARHAERVANLRLARPELAVNFRQTSRLDATFEDVIEFLASRGDVDNMFPRFLHVSRRRESHGNVLRSCFIRERDRESVCVCVYTQIRARETRDG